MKAIMLLLFAFVGSAFAQVYYSNNVSRAQAIQVASQLKAGMWEEKASAILATNGIQYATSIGAITGWKRNYGLSDGSSLALDYAARELKATNGLWGGNGLLLEASIESNGVKIVSIALTNTP